MVTRNGCRLLRFGGAGSKAISSMFFGRAPDAHMPTAQAIGVGLSIPSPRSFLAEFIPSRVSGGFSLQSLTRAPTYFSVLTTGLPIYKTHRC
jgi:hypothetical protein